MSIGAHTELGGGRDLRNVVRGKIERNDPETHLASEMDVYVRYNWAVGEIRRLLPAAPRVLELGSGLGWFGRVVGRTFPGSTYVGVDLDPAAVAESARRTGPLGDRVRFIQGDVTRLSEVPIERGTFDAIVWMQNIEHVNPPNFVDLVERARAFLKPGGLFLVETPNRIGGGGLNASGPMTRHRGQHNPHHFLELTLAEARYLFPGARITGYEVSSTLPPIARRAAHAAGRLAARLRLWRVAEHVEHRGTFAPGALAAELVLGRFPRLNRCFLIRQRATVPSSARPATPS